jgi:hypothetical protein
MTNINRESIRMVLGSFVAILFMMWVLTTIGCDATKCKRGHWELIYERATEDYAYKEYHKKERWICDEYEIHLPNPVR